jgi:uncharacterized membrane protein
MLEQTARLALATRALARATMSTARTAPVATYMATVSVPEDGGTAATWTVHAALALTFVVSTYASQATAQGPQDQARLQPPYRG